MDNIWILKSAENDSLESDGEQNSSVDERRLLHTEQVLDNHLWLNGFTAVGPWSESDAAVPLSRAGYFLVIAEIDVLWRKCRQLLVRVGAVEP